MGLGGKDGLGVGDEGENRRSGDLLMEGMSLMG